MKLLNNFLTSGHSFSKNENLQKFRFALLNSLLIISSSFTLLNHFASKFEFVTFSPAYNIALLLYTFSSFFYIFVLRKEKSYYLFIVHIGLIGAWSLFYFALISAIQDEFRLIWFFLSLFAGFVLLGKRYGLFLMIFTLGVVFITNFVEDLGYSKLALFTFFNSFLVFTAFAYAFLYKIENDALEFKLLNDKLKEKVSEEVQQRQEQEQMLLQQCRLASMGEMIDSIAHQWRQPLMNINAILMNMDRAIETKDKPPAYMEEKMDEIITLTTHMSQTIEDFRSLFKTDKENISFNVASSIKQGLQLFNNALKDVDVHLSNGKKHYFYGHPNELTQVIIILLSNAIEALDNRKIDTKALTISLEEKKKTLSITFEDNAGGIKKAYLDTIFDPYFTTKEATGGTGLGLYIAKIIIEQNMQGTLTVTNTKEGAKFTISLPNK